MSLAPHSWDSIPLWRRYKQTPTTWPWDWKREITRNKSSAEIRYPNKENKGKNNPLSWALCAYWSWDNLTWGKHFIFALPAASCHAMYLRTKGNDFFSGKVSSHCFMGDSYFMERIIGWKVINNADVIVSAPVLCTFIQIIKAVFDRHISRQHYYKNTLPFW